ncbi:PucR family transcriptional regulator [Oceanobacillus zhaokaii]|uniref:PucR family transcriptional regulator n=1 Tax=Oceanobacillus zhaokaii TaxID=2052660 RepID=A0A345PLP2_9BACI|nr:PucR family transcriptional regulator ligand-binding domain-containing protein [Oceanobacillus zhaokaii]AXI10922.1 PucR family transcriptional regulator [Oceanobacillus zhaokaii]
MSNLNLTVKDVLSRESFRCATIIAGSTGLNRQVKWSHVLETQEFDTLINGGELILTTGIGLQSDVKSQHRYIKRLIEKNAAGICIELGPNFKEIHSDIAALANESQFPIIVFNEIVKFVDITQDLHTFIINQHHQMLSKLDALSRKFISLSLKHNGVLKILQELHEMFRQSIFFIGTDGKLYYFPAKSKDKAASIREGIEASSIDNLEPKTLIIGDDTFAMMPVRGLGQTWGHLCLQMEHPLYEDFLFLVLDRAAIAIVQILLRNRTIEERKQNMESKLIQKLLNGQEYEQDDIQTYLPAPSRNMHFRVFLIQLDYIQSEFIDEEWEELKVQRSILIRSIFKRNGFFPAISVKKNQIVVIAFFLATEDLKQDTNRFIEITQYINKMNDNSFIDGRRCTFGASIVYEDILDIRAGYHEASQALKLHKSHITKTYFYEDLGIYKILLALKDNNYLDAYVNEYLSPVFDYDQKTASNLFETLTVYLECGGSKKDASDRLFIVRQTLYHRIDRLEMLLGKNFMEPSNRLALEVAIKAYELLNDKNNMEG